MSEALSKESPSGESKMTIHCNTCPFSEDICNEIDEQCPLDGLEVETEYDNEFETALTEASADLMISLWNRRQLELKKI